MRIAIIGSGYVGLVTGACLTEVGHEVWCVDRDLAKVARVNQGEPTCHEVGLTALLTRHVGQRLRATTDLAAAVRQSELTMIAVGTPSGPSGIDLSQVLGAAADIGQVLRTHPGWHSVIVKSTVVPGSTEGPIRAALEASSGRRCGVDLGLGMNPEFLTEGTAVADFSQPDRLVLGALDARTLTDLERVYAPYADTPVVRTSCTSAELIKYASNALLATLISFSNELSRLAVHLPGVDIAEVLRGVHASQYLRVRPATEAPIARFIEAGCGFGGSCLPKDVAALAARGAELGVPMPLMHDVLAINRTQPDALLALIEAQLPDLHGRAVTVLGLAFKPDTDDVRESPAFPIIERLRARGAVLTAYDPVVGAATGAHQLPALQDVTLAPSMAAAVAAAEVIVVVTRWGEFQSLAEVLRAAGRQPWVVDGRRCLNPEDFPRYLGIGRAPRPT